MKSPGNRSCVGHLFSDLPACSKTVETDRSAQFWRDYLRAAARLSAMRLRQLQQLLQRNLGEL